MERSGAGSKRIARTEAIVREARRLFEERSYENVTMRDIADAVGVSPGLIYRYRASKAEILADVFLKHVKEQASYLEALTSPEGSAYERVMYYLRGMFAFDLDNLAVRRLAATQSWEWEKGYEYFFVVEVIEIFIPIIRSTEEIGLDLDLDGRWALWAIYTEALRRSAHDIKSVDAFDEQIGPQVALIVRGCESGG